MRAGLIELAGRGGRRSAARQRACIFCGEPSRNPVKHAIGKCRYFDPQREVFSKIAAPGTNRTEDITLFVLTQKPGDEHFAAALAFCADVDREASEYWCDVGMT